MYRTSSRINPPQHKYPQVRPLDEGLVRRYQKNRAHALMPRLKELDPAGWEAWIDSDAVPDPTRRGWTGVANAIQARILELEATPPAADAPGCNCFVCRGENLAETFPNDPDEHISGLVMASSDPNWQ